MKRKHIIFLAAIALTFGLFSCQKQNNTSPAVTGPSTLNVKLQAVNPSFTLKNAYAGTKSATATPSIAWDSAKMVVSSVKFEASLKKSASDQDSVEIEYKWNGPKMVNLLDTTATFGNFTLQQGYYDQVELKVLGLSRDAAGGLVFYLHGMYTKNDTVTLPIIVKSYKDVLFKTEKDSVNVTSNSAADITSYIQLYLDKLMANVTAADLDNAELTDSTIVISDSTNTELYNAIIRNLDGEHHCYYRHNDDKGEHGDKGGGEGDQSDD